jgi:hypothetical protein
MTSYKEMPGVVSGNPLLTLVRVSARDKYGFSQTFTKGYSNDGTLKKSPIRVFALYVSFSFGFMRGEIEKVIR